LFGKAFGWLPVCLFAAISISYYYRPSVKADEYGLSIPVGVFASRHVRWSDIAYVQAVRGSKRRRLSLYPLLRFWIWGPHRRKLAVSFDQEIGDLSDLLALIDQKHAEYRFPLHYYVNDSRNTRVPVPKPLPRGPVIASLSSLMAQP